MAQSSKYYKIDEDVLLEFIYHDQSQPSLYEIEVDDNGSEIMILNTVAGDDLQSRHLINELGSAVVNFDVTQVINNTLAVENFAKRTLVLETGKTYKFNLSTLPDPTGFYITGSLGTLSSPSNGVVEYTPTQLGAVEYGYADSTGLSLEGGKVNVADKANPLFSTPSEDTGNSLDQNIGRYHAINHIGDSAKWALLGYDTQSPYEKWNYIDNYPTWTGSNSADLLSSQTSATSSINFIRYDSIRLHLRSGFSFAARNYDGFMFEVKASRTNGIKNNLTQLVYLNTSNYEISNPKPFMLGETLYTKFVNLKVPTLVNQNFEFDNFFYPDGNGGSNLDPTSNYEVSFKLIDRLENVAGFDLAVTAEEVNFTISREDDFQDFTVNVEDAADGDYFIIQGERNGSASSFESYILNRINTSSDDIIVMYEVEVYEQHGISQIKTFDTTFTQVEDFNTPITFRPIIQNSSAVNFSIDVTMRIYNETDNTQIVKRASLTSNEVGKYGKNLLKVNINSANKLTEIYNVLPNLSSNRSVRDSLINSLPRTTKFVPTFIERHNVVASTTPVNIQVANNSDVIESVEDLDSSPYVLDGQVSIYVPPTTSYYKFRIAKKRGDDLEMINLSTIKGVYLNFFDGVNRKNFLHVTNKEVNMGEGEILFKVDEANAQQIRRMSDKQFFISVDNGSESTMLIKGKFTV